MTRRYTIVLTPEPDGSAYNVTVPTLPGCLTWGASVEQAVARAREAIAGHIGALVDIGEPVPVEGAPSLLRTVEVELPADAVIEEALPPVDIRVVRANAGSATHRRAIAKTIADEIASLNVRTVLSA